jgi:transcriptional regulator with XRE-family HTH domain
VGKPATRRRSGGSDDDIDGIDIDHDGNDPDLEVGAMVNTAPGAMIAAARRRRGLSQAALARHLCAAARMATVSRHEVSRWECGRRLPSAYWLEPLSAVLGIDRPTLDRAVGQARHDRRLTRAIAIKPLAGWRITRVRCASPLPLDPAPTARRIEVASAVQSEQARGRSGIAGTTGAAVIVGPKEPQ